MGDEINRMSTLAQAALFGPMSEGRCTMQSPQLTPEETVKYMPAVRIFLCTQNDVGSEGTNILPPAQLDRFLHRIKPGRISREAEKELLLNPRLVDHGILEEVKAKRVLTIDEILATRKWVQENIHVSEAFIDFQLSVIRATVPGTPEFRDLWQNHLKIRPILDQIKSGVSVRGDLNLQRACQVEAFLHGTKEDRQTPRKIVLPVDLKRLAHSVMDHRIVMQERATHRRTNGTSIQNPFSNQYPADGSITRAQVIHRLENTGPILPEHVVDAILTHIDPTDDPAAYARA
jgi:MoxR-like ATPase